jgi:DNA-binding XRE family transcriptional regulator
MTQLRRLRLLAGMRQVDVAEAANCSRRTVVLLEAGGQVPHLSTALAISRAVGCRDPRVVFPELVDPPTNIGTPMLVAPGAERGGTQ